MSPPFRSSSPRDYKILKHGKSIPNSQHENVFRSDSNKFYIRYSVICVCFKNCCMAHLEVGKCENLGTPISDNLFQLRFDVLLFDSRNTDILEKYVYICVNTNRQSSNFSHRNQIFLSNIQNTPYTKAVSNVFTSISSL